MKAVNRSSDPDRHKEPLPPGHYIWLKAAGTDRISAIKFGCPCGCGKDGAVNVTTGPDTANAWSWNGNLHLPTLTPSLQRLDDCEWHGWLRNGIWLNA